MPHIKINGINTYYEITGSGEPLVFVHGLGSCTLDWEYQVEFFPRNYQVITYDLRGHGRTDKPAGPYTIKLFSADTAALLQALDIRNAHIGGISLGGMIVLQLAVDEPQLIQSAIITNCLASTIAKNFRIRLELMKRRIIFKIMPFAKKAEIIAQTILPEAQMKEQRKIFVSRFMANDPAAYYSAFLSVMNWSVAERLGNIKCPALVISSEFDNTPVAAKEAYVKLMPQARLAVVKGARHGLTIEYPQKFNDVVMEFLEQQK
ncbi:MAG TPA: alpha/beta hydrolase [Smithellaceae bacterium]|nr:alpha/beta hydrolase [Smithellaceae bacterium]